MKIQKENPARAFAMIAKTIRGAEDVAAAELRALGASKVETQSCAVKFVGGKYLLYKANLWSRTAMRILAPVRDFCVEDKDELYREAGRVNWSRFMDADGTLAVDAFINNSAFDNSVFVAQRVKDAIVDQFRSRTGRRPNVDLKNPGLRVNIYIEGKRAILSLDSSGEPLFRRGYRTESGEAPINEVLAACIIALSQWDGRTLFIDPMCGSGTFVIEAALLARRKATGLLRRSFGFMRWRDYDGEIFERVCSEAADAALPHSSATIIGSDISPERIKEAVANARRAGVERDICFECAAFEERTPPPSPGTLIMNPPYGNRVKVEDAEAFYRKIGDTLKNKYDGFNAFIFTNNALAAKAVVLRTSRRIPLFNGSLECRLLKYEMYQGTRKVKNMEPGKLNSGL